MYVILYVIKRLLSIAQTKTPNPVFKRSFAKKPAKLA